MDAAAKRGLGLLALGIACLMLPVHYSFYRYSIVGEGLSYTVMLLAGLGACVAGAVGRDRLRPWLAKRPAAVAVLAVATLASNGLLANLGVLGLAEPLGTLVQCALAAFFAAVFVLLFYAWVQRLSDALFQMPITAVMGVVGCSVVLLYLLVDAFYGTPLYVLAGIGCLAVSGVCWQACPLGPVQERQRLRALPTAQTLKAWVPLLVAYVLVTLLHALVFSAEGTVFERSSAHAWFIDVAMVVVGVLFAGLAYTGRLKGVPPQRALVLITALITMFYVGVCCVAGTPGMLGEGGLFAVLTMVVRTLKVFVLFVLVMLDYRDAAAPLSTLGLLFLAVELLADLVCYVTTPAVLALAGTDLSLVVGPVLRVSSLVLAAVFLVFLAASLLSMARLAQAAAPSAWVPADTVRAPAEDDRRRACCREIALAFGLTEREADIMYFLSLGFSVKKIAELLTISTNTVATHSSRLYRKLGVHTRQEVIDVVDARLQG